MTKENAKLEEEISSLSGNREQTTNYVRKRKKTPPSVTSGNKDLNLWTETPSKFPGTKPTLTSIQSKAIQSNEFLNNEYSGFCFLSFLIIL